MTARLSNFAGSIVGSLTATALTPALLGEIYGIPSSTTTSADNAVVIQGQVIIGLAKDTGHAWRAGDQLYWDSTNTKATRTPGPYILGKANAAAAAASTTGDVYIDARIGALCGSVLAASTAVTNTVTETDFDKTITIPANFLVDGTVLRIRAQAIATATNSTDTLNLKLYVAGTNIAATGAIDVANNDIGIFDGTVIIRTDTAAGTMVAMGLTSIGTPGTATARPFSLGSTTVDTTAACIVKVSATWSVANAGNSCRLDLLTVERIG